MSLTIKCTNYARKRRVRIKLRECTLEYCKSEFDKEMYKTMLAKGVFGLG